MNRRAVTQAAAGAFLLAAGAWLSFLAGQPNREERIDTGTCVVPISIFDSAHARESIIVFHGVSANRRLMLTLGRWLRSEDVRVYLVDLPGHGDSTEPFSFAKADACAASLLETLERTGQINPASTALVGHSMGGAIAIRMADVLPVAATVAISPAPLDPDAGTRPELVFFSPPHRMPANLYVTTGEWEPDLARQNAERLVARAGGSRFSPEDFRERRAVARIDIPHATHVRQIFSSRVAGNVWSWIQQSLGAPETSRVLYAWHPLLGPWAGVLGLLLLFSAVANLAIPQSTQSEQAQPAPFLPDLALWTIVAIVVVCVLRLAVPAGPVIRMYGGGYLASVLMVGGLVLLLARRRWPAAAPYQPNWNVRGVYAAIILGIAAILAFGAWLNWQLTDAWLNAPRWWRFALLVPLVLPYHLAEEFALGAPRQHGSLGVRLRAQTRRYGTMMALRGVLWLAMVGGIFLLGSGEILMLLLAMFFLAFSLFQRWTTDAIRRRTGSAGAAAVFNAILAAWFIAAAFPIT